MNKNQLMTFLKLQKTKLFSNCNSIKNIPCIGIGICKLIISNKRKNQSRGSSSEGEVEESAATCQQE